jgi:hypothetical protein
MTGFFVDFVKTYLMELIVLIVLLVLSITIINYYSREYFKGGRGGGRVAGYMMNRFFGMPYSTRTTQGKPNGSACKWNRECISRVCKNQKCVSK